MNGCLFINKLEMWDWVYCEKNIKMSWGRGQVSIFYNMNKAFIYKVGELRRYENPSTVTGLQHHIIIK